MRVVADEALSPLSQRRYRKLEKCYNERAMNAWPCNTIILHASKVWSCDQEETIDRFVHLDKATAVLSAR